MKYIEEIKHEAVVEYSTVLVLHIVYVHPM